MPVVVILVLMTPLIFTRRAFWTDSSNHLWLSLEQQRAVHAHGWPTYFVSSDRTGLFSPVFAFYGGSGYALIGLLGAILGDRITLANELSWLFAFVMAYVGLSWLALQAGLRGWRAHVPGLVFVTSAYYLTNVYGRGDWGEAMATSAIPLVAASGLWLLLAQRWRVVPLLAFIVSVATLTATHNITALWAVTFFGALGLMALLICWSSLRTVSVRRYLAVAIVAALATMVNGLYLLPDLAYASRTRIASSSEPFMSQFAGYGTSWYDRPGQVFNLFRSTPLPNVSPSLYVQLPVLILGWALLILLIKWRRLQNLERRIACGLLLLGTLFLGFILFEAPWSYLPRPWHFAQYAFRLTTYVVLIIAGATIVGLRAVGRTRSQGRWVTTGALVLFLAFGMGLATWQVWASKSALATRASALTRPGKAPMSWYDTGSYSDQSRRALLVEPGRTLSLDPKEALGGKFDETVNPPAGPQPIATNISAGAYFLNITGLIPVGITGSSDRFRVRGYHTTIIVFSPDFRMVVRRPDNRLSGPLRVTIGRSSSVPIVAGRLTSLTAIAVLASIVGVLAWRRTRQIAIARLAGATPASRS